MIDDELTDAQRTASLDALARRMEAALWPPLLALEGHPPNRHARRGLRFLLRMRVWRAIAFPPDSVAIPSGIERGEWARFVSPRLLDAIQALDAWLKSTPIRVRDMPRCIVVEAVDAALRMRRLGQRGRPAMSGALLP